MMMIDINTTIGQRALIPVAAFGRPIENAL